jgi:hypothetical protein
MGNMLGGLQTGLTIQGMAQAQKQKVLTAQRDETMRADLATLGQNPSVNAIQSAILKYPELENHFKPIIENMSAREKDEAISVGSRVYAAVHNKDFSSADKILDLQIEAYKNNGREAESQSMVQIKDLLAKNPSTAMTTIGLFLASSMGREKFAENFERFEKLDPSIKKIQAETNKSVGDETRAANSALTDKAAKEAATKKVLSDIGVDEAKMNMLPESVQKLVNENVEDSLVADADSKRTLDLASRIETGISSDSGGLSSKGWSALKTASGFEGTEEQLKTEYNVLRSKITMSNLPPGVATDKDVALAMSGTPGPDARPSTLASFLRGVSKLRAYDSRLAQAKSIWFNENKHLGKAKGEIEIFGTKSKPNETFIEFTKRAGGDFIVPTGDNRVTELNEKDVDSFLDTL